MKQHRGRYERSQGRVAPYYHASTEEFLRTPCQAIVGLLVTAQGGDCNRKEVMAWLEELDVLKKLFEHLSDYMALRSYIMLEYVLPRVGRRADALILAGDAVFVIEFKIGQRDFRTHDIEQVHDYALCIKYFFPIAERFRIVPVLYASKAGPTGVQDIVWDRDGVARPLRAGAPEDLSRIIQAAKPDWSYQWDDRVLEAWLYPHFRPTPSIVEAARALFAGHRVEEITRTDAEAEDVAQTLSELDHIINETKRRGEKAICFVTGVPGSGKTLVGLRLAVQGVPSLPGEHGTFLSGNRPLVEVLREALARDFRERRRMTLQEARRLVLPLIQHLRDFRDDFVRNRSRPYERIVVFDEAQRAWSQDQLAAYLRARLGVADWDLSEPATLMAAIDRREGWAVLVCLVGEGQEINRGEAGLSEWARALDRLPHAWSVYASDLALSRLSGSSGQSFPGRSSRSLRCRRLHLSASMRSFRAHNLSDFVDRLLEADREGAARAYSELSRYPIAVTRDLKKAREWLRMQARGSERFGLLASSKGLRLRAEGVWVEARVDPVVWFLNDRSDVRSSFYLEEPGREFDVQGLELDWSCICWDANLRFENGRWTFYSFSGTRWNRVRNPRSKEYLINSYRVLLTRARQGMIVFVPKGDRGDATRLPRFYDGVFDLLVKIGIPEV